MKNRIRKIALFLVICLTLQCVVTGINPSPVSAELITTCAPTLDAVVNEDGTVTVSIKATGNVEVFDFGLMYEAEQVTCTKSSWNSTFRNTYSEYSGMYVKNDMSDYRYIVFGGTANDNVQYDGEIATATFTFADSVTQTVFRITTDSAHYKKMLDAEHKKWYYKTKTTICGLWQGGCYGR